MNNIAMQFQPSTRLESQQNMLAAALQMQGAQQQNQLARMQLDQHKQGLVDQQELRNALSAPGADPYAEMVKRGRLKEANDWRKGQADASKAATDSEAATFKLASDRHNLFTSELTALRNAPNLSKSLVAQRIGRLADQGLFKREVYESSMASLPDDPEQLRQHLDQDIYAKLTPEQKVTLFAAKPTEVSDGQQKVFRDTNPLSKTYGQNTAGAPIQMQVTPDGKATREATERKGVQDTEMKLADDWRAQSKNFKEVADANKTINAALNYATTSPVATLAGATKFMKMIDPGSVVRESELGMAMAAHGVFDRATNYINVLNQGKTLTAQQVADFRNIASQVYQAAQDMQRGVDANYTRQAGAYGLRPDLIIQDLGQNAQQPTKPAKPGKHDLTQFKVLGVEE